MPEMKRIKRDEVVAAIAAALKPLDYVYAMWEGGAIAFDRLDEWSDIDICVSAEDDRIESVFPMVEEALESIAPIELKHEVTGPKLGEYVQAFYRLEGGGPYMLVDFAVFKHSAEDKLLQPEIHGNCRFHFNKKGAVAVPPLDAEAFLARLKASLERLASRYEMFRAFGEKEIQRGNHIAALDFYHRFILAALIQALYMKHHPAHYDFGRRYVYYDLPADVVEGLERLHFVEDPEDLAAKYQEACQWFEESAGSISMEEAAEHLT